MVQLRGGLGQRATLHDHRHLSNIPASADAGVASIGEAGKGCGKVLSRRNDLPSNAASPPNRPIPCR